MDYVDLTEYPIEPGEIVTKVLDPECGAIATFFGTTRAYDAGKVVLRLEYESYSKMAIVVLQDIVAECRSKWSTLQHLAVVHRLGSVSAGEISIALAASSPHRAAALNAVQYALESVKSRAPIWKKEVYEDNSSRWKQNKECLHYCRLSNERYNVE
ncbi:hypothetical protein AHF37_06789 [Paragonimus kellicotti]|nr:hypothetical protein AHF37_06789 [Paragonimus kellicotti]